MNEKKRSADVAATLKKIRKVIILILVHIRLKCTFNFFHEPILTWCSAGRLLSELKRSAIMM